MNVSSACGGNTHLTENTLVEGTECANMSSDFCVSWLQTTRPCKRHCQYSFLSASRSKICQRNEVTCRSVRMITLLNSRSVLCLWSLFLWEKQSDLLSLRQRLTWTALAGKVVCFHLKYFVMQRRCVHCVAVCNWSRTWLAAMRSVCSFWMRRFMAFSSSSFLWLISSIFVLQTNKE